MLDIHIMYMILYKHINHYSGEYMKEDFTSWLLEPEEYNQELQAIESLEDEIEQEFINELLQEK